MKNAQIARAAELGKIAANTGIKAPYQCKETMSMVEGNKVGDPQTKAIFNAWLSSFHKELANKMFSTNA